MINLSTLIILTIQFVYILSQCFDDLPLSTSETEMQTKVTQLIESKQKIDETCLDQLFQRGYYNEAQNLFEQYYVPNKIDVLERLRNQMSDQQKQLNDFVKIVKASNERLQEIEPIIQWAQNKYDVFIYVKLAMRSSSPACVSCKKEVVEFNDSNLYLTFYGIYSNQPLRFKLNLTLYDGIVSDNCILKQESAGQLSITLEKSEPGILWNTLEKDPKRKVPVWWEMYDKNSKDMKDWSEQVEAQEQRKEDEKRNKKKEEKQQAKKEKEDMKALKDEKKQKKIKKKRSSENATTTEEEDIGAFALNKDKTNEEHIQDTTDTQQPTENSQTEKNDL